MVPKGERARGNWILGLRAQKIISHPRREKPLPAQFILLKSPTTYRGDDMKEQSIILQRRERADASPF
jgi:hypothetical protein